MSNPWLKKNPFMSVWLSGANSLANTARGKVTAEAKRQSTAAVNQAASDMINIWTRAAITPAAAATAATPKRKQRR